MYDTTKKYLLYQVNINEKYLMQNLTKHFIIVVFTWNFEKKIIKCVVLIVKKV